MNNKITTSILRQYKSESRTIVMLTAYDYPMAKLLDEAGVDMLLVGDSLGNVVLGYDSTIPVTMEDMLHHVKAVCRGAKRAMVVADMPFMSYQISIQEALKNAGRLLQEGGAQAVKLEGGIAMAATVQVIVTAGIPVVGHLGLTPQSVNQLGGFKVQARDEQAAQKLLDDARALETAGAFALVLECIPDGLARRVSESIHIPTIGIGAGVACDGQVLVIHDLLGLNSGFTPKFVKKYADLHHEMMDVIQKYIGDVKERKFPSEEHSFKIADTILEKLY
ncbi:3-methyl-2-oxobutanoate hydroxymethyltransferase [Sporomusaceae bacterium BoRhaA]|uniref:3-methyl-2-oxobutanoate hydroxymethyltransferase n=1 Tax=Pelorhabdus rhamnosifermentans TaxID=2772457 RepID=UPI001C061113|nr:3-methyl-2-oxobutanoate hydroxymethyltransferase [Pelorhabdus rhamnosifermentans]MBU2703272.1 3-methyl-2-oxobutanoate hydroxymethyltransferase [Pelorhabdus rhamnosifermentans]